MNMPLLFFFTLLLCPVVTDAKVLTNCQDSCDADLTGDLQTLDAPTRAAEIVAVFADMTVDVRRQICWHFYDFIHCLKHCEKAEFSDWKYLNSTCYQETSEMSQSFQCLTDHHSAVESHCASFISAAVREQNAIQSDATLREKICSYLNDHSLCLIANMEFYCGSLAVQLFTKENMELYFRTFIQSRTQRLLRPEVSAQCYNKFDSSMSATAAHLISNTTKTMNLNLNSTPSPIVTNVKGFPAALVVLIVVILCIFVAQVVVLLLNKVVVRIIYHIWKEICQ